MSNTDKLKTKAAEFEKKKQYEKALELYEQALNHTRAGDEDRDVPLYNRVGDLHYRIGNNEQAIGYYEKAADLYAEGGFFNNAIALCNKILRYSPGRTVIYYKLGIISAKKGFNSDAKQNFLEYADRMQRLGKMDEAFRALKEFADLCPGQDDVRLMLAEQLARADRKPEALEQLQLLYDRLEAEGRSAEAAAAVERMKTIDPTFLPKRSASVPQRKKEGLVFLDLDFESAIAAIPQPPADVQSTNAAASGSDEVTVPEGFIEAPQDAPEGLELTSVARSPAAAITPLALESLSDAENYPSPSASSDLVFIVPAIDDVPQPADRSEETDVEQAHYEPIELASLDLVQKLDTIDLAPEPVRSSTPSPAPDDDFVDLGDWLERNRTPASTRMVTHDEEPEDNEQKDFAEMLEKFKDGISRNVDDADFESHYDLGIAFREMGLLDEAIGCFQKASRGEMQRVRASEAMGECFIDKDEPGVAMSVLERLASDSKLNDDDLVGVLYLLGRAKESLGRLAEAESCYHRVTAVHIGFRDTRDRLSSLAQSAR